jgi:phage-related protein
LPEKEEKTFAKKTVEKLDDEIVGDYQDSTVASDFDILQKFIDEQFKTLNESIKNIPGSAFGGVTKIFSAGIGKIWGGISLLSKNVKGFAKNTVSRISGFAKSIAGGTIGKIGKAISGLGKGIGSVMKGIGGLGSKLKTGIASAFGGIGAKIGGFFSKLNPFKKS